MTHKSSGKREKEKVRKREILVVEKFYLYTHVYKKESIDEKKLQINNISMAHGMKDTRKDGKYNKGKKREFTISKSWIVHAIERWQK